MQMLRPLLSPVLWERPGNVPALVRLARAYLSKASTEIVQTGTLTVKLLDHTHRRLGATFLNGCNTDTI